ncbi:acyltransferase [Microbacterium esteraromaticum]|uniref:acyltransferase family protein n=1 Tax=Microbacterium esteraromaticum TaxID=57043 RepID=UPI002367F72B|nr:acyltransferase [Microbacterium esteraromaticum]WDH79442.1 acyltransferase [Microbacterium esteraromaticum]
MRFRELDGLRGIAALLVLLSHYTGAHNSYFPNDPQPMIDVWWGAFGVQLFFLVSGFVILMSAEAAQRPSDFVISRFSRLYPTYWIALAIGVIIGAAFAVPNVPLAPDVVAMNLTMVQRWFLVPNVLDVFWTLAVEMQFYVLILLLLVLTRCRLSEKLMVRVSLAWLVVCLLVAIWAFPASYGLDPQLVPTPVKVVLNITLAAYGPLFCTGMLAFISRRAGRMHLLLIPSAIVAVAVSGLVEHWRNAVIVAIICVLFIIVSMRKQTRLLLIAPLQWTGKISYSLYLVHSIVGYVVIHQLWPFIGRPAAVLVATGVALLVAWIMYKTAERKLSRGIRTALVRARDRRSGGETVPLASRD